MELFVWESGMYSLKLTMDAFVGYGASQLLFIPSFGPLGRSYKVICMWLPHVLGLEALRRAMLRTKAGCPLC